MTTVLQKLIEQANAKNYYSKGFAMLNCGALLKSTELEGDTHAQALDYFAKIVSATNNASDEFISDEQKKLCNQAMESLAYFSEVYPHCLADPDDRTSDINPEKLIEAIEIQCQKQGHCYLPSGWLGKPGHYVSLKITKNDDNSYDISFLNGGAGVNHHYKLGKSDEKTKYDYQSHVYRFDLNSDSAKLFFHGILGLYSGAYADADKQCDEQDLYGLLALHGQLKEVGPDLKRQITPQRSGTCAITNTRMAIKDTLLINGGLSSDDTNRYEFFNKLSSIVTAYTSLMATPDAQKNEAELQLLELALKELYVRLEKLHPRGLSDEELAKIREYADTVSHQVTTFQQIIIDEACKEKEQPSFTVEYQLSPLPETTEIIPKPPEINAPLAKSSLAIRRCEPEEVNDYILESLDYFSNITLSPQIVYELKLWMHSLAATSATPYWDRVPENELSTILHNLVLLNNQFKELSKNDKLELALISYDIAAQIAPRIPELQLGNNFCLGLDDTFTDQSAFTDPVTFLSISNLANNFIKRSANKTPVFSHTITEPRSMQNYVMSLLDGDTKTRILAKLKEKKINIDEDLSDEQWLELVLTQRVNNNDVDIMPFLPGSLSDIRALSSLSQQSTTQNYTAEESKDGRGVDYFLYEHTYQQHKKMAEDYSSSSGVKIGSDASTLKEIIPFDQIRQNNNKFSDFSESTIYQADSKRVKRKGNKVDSALPWSNDYDGKIDSGKGLYPSAKHYYTVERILTDETLKRIQLDKGFAFQRVLARLEDDITLWTINNVTGELLNCLFQYGAVYSALETSPDETNQQIKKTLAKGYAYYQDLMNKSDKIDSFKLKKFLDFCDIETFYRTWALALDKGQLLDDTFPTCQTQLRELLLTAQKTNQSKVAQALLANLKTLTPLSAEDLQFLLLSQLLITIDQKCGPKEAESSTALQAIESWHHLKPELKKTLSLMTPEECTEFVQKMLVIMGHASLFSKEENWLYEDPLIKSVNGRAAINLESSEISIDGTPLIHSNSANARDERIFGKLGVDISKLHFIPIPESTPFPNCQFQADAPDGTRYYLAKQDKKRIKKFVTIDEQRFLCDLTIDYGSGYSSGKIIKLLNQNDLINPYKINSFLNQILWHDPENKILITHHPKKKHKGMMCDPNGVWHKLLKTDKGWERQGTVLLNPKDKSNSLVKEWGSYLAHFTNPDDLRFVATLTEDNKTFTLKSINIPQLDLNFINRDNKLYCREYPEFYLSTAQGSKELNGLTAIVILENIKGDKKYLLPKADFKNKGDPFYSRNPLGQKAQGYEILEHDNDGQFKGKSAESNFRLALTFALQGDYQKAMHSLKLSYSHKPNSKEIVALMQKYDQCKPNTPQAYAFYYHLHLRFLEHDFKWTKDYTPVPKKTRKALDRVANKNLADYLESISARREGVDIIPDYLHIPQQPSNSADSFQQYLAQLLGGATEAFTDKPFSATDKQIHQKENIAAISVLTNHQRQEKMPFYPPLRVIADKSHRSGMNKLGTNFSDIDNTSAFFHAYFVNLFELAVSESSTDTERFNSYLFHIIHSAKYEDQRLNRHIAILRYIHNNKDQFSDLKSLNTTIDLLTAIFSRLNPEQKIENPDIFSVTPTPLITSTITKAPHWLEKENQRNFSLAHIQLNDAIKQPLGQELNRFFDTEKRPIATTPLAMPSEPNLTPIEEKIIQNYQTGFAANLGRERLKFTLKPDAREGLSTYLTQAIKDQEAQLATLQNQLLTLANQLPDDSAREIECNMIKAARMSGKRPAIDISNLITCLLQQDTSTLTHSNPFLTQPQINNLLQLICDYALESSKLAQCKEAKNLITDHAKSEPFPPWVEQLLGETLAKTRTYSPQDYPELLVYEYATGTMLREGQAEKIIQLINIIDANPDDTESYRLVLLQFAAGGGKTAVLIPILAQRFAQKGDLPVIMNTNELYSIAEQEIPDSLKRSFNQNLEVVERELDFKWTNENCDQLLTDLERWRQQKKSLLLKSITWHSIHLAHKAALDEGKSQLAASTKKILDFFATKCIKLEDEGHLISDPLQSCIRTDPPKQTFHVEQTNLMLDFYRYLMGEQNGCEQLVELSGINEQSKKSVSASELTDIQTLLASTVGARPEFKELNSQLLNDYLLSPDKERPDWLQDLYRSNRVLADNVVLARSFIKTHLPHILTLQYKRDYGSSIHKGDLTAAPKHDGQDVSSHFADPVLVLALTTQMVKQQGVPKEHIKTIFTGLKAKHDQQKGSSQRLTEAEMQIIMLLPDKYLHSTIDSLNPDMLAKDEDVKFSKALIDYYLKVYAYPQIKVPTKLYISTPADLQAGFKAGVIFTATPGLPETYPVQLKPENLLLSQEFEAEVISTLLDEKNKKSILIDAVQTPDDFFNQLKEKNPEQFQQLTALIDRGALLANFDNQKISNALQTLLAEDINRANTLFFDGDVMKLDSKEALKPVTLKGTRIIEALQAQGFALEEVMVFLFLDLARTTGTDVKRPYQDRAGLTVGKEQTLTDTIQAAMRERQLLREDAQSVVWIMFQSLYEKINADDPAFDLNQVFLWMIKNQANHDEHKVLMRAYQGLDQLINDFARHEVDKGAITAKSIEHTLSKQVSLSIWELYELATKEDDTEVVLNAYVQSLCKQYGLKSEQFPTELSDQIKRIINETKLLIPRMHHPHGSELNGEVVHEHQQQQETQQQQQQQQQQTLLNRHNSGSNVKMMLETYDDSDELDAIFNKTTPGYSEFSFSEWKDINLPKFLLNPRHFTHVQQQSYGKIQHLQPLDTIIIQRTANGDYHYLACSPIGAKVFREQLKARSFEKDSPGYMFADSSGRMLCQYHCEDVMVNEAQASDTFTDIINYLELLNGKITHPEKMSAFIKKHNIDKPTYLKLVSKIKEVHVSPAPIELEDLPYFEYLCGWKHLDDRIVQRLAGASEQAVSPKTAETRASSPESANLPERAVPGLMPDVMKSILPPCVLGLEEKVLHLALVSPKVEDVWEFEDSWLDVVEDKDSWQEIPEGLWETGVSHTNYDDALEELKKRVETFEPSKKTALLIMKTYELINHIERLHAKGKTKDDLINVLNSTNSLLKGDQTISSQAYCDLAKTMQGKPSPGMKTLGKLMIAVAVLAVAAGIVLAATGVGLAAGVGTAAAGALVGTIGVAFFAKGRQSGLSKKMSNVEEAKSKDDDLGGSQKPNKTV